MVTRLLSQSPSSTLIHSPQILSVQLNRLDVMMDIIVPYNVNFKKFPLNKSKKYNFDIITRKLNNSIHLLPNITINYCSMKNYYPSYWVNLQTFKKNKYNNAKITFKLITIQLTINNKAKQL